MANRNWGGRRAGAGAGPGPRRKGAGRPRERWNSGGRGTIWHVDFARSDGLPERRQWRVLNVEADGTIEFQDVETEEIISFVPLDEQ